MRETMLVAVLLAHIPLAIPLAALATEGAARGASSPASPLPVEAVKKAVDEHVQARMREGNGVYRLQDALTGRTLELVFEHTGVVAAEGVWSVHDKALRTSGGHDYYACTMFHPAHGPEDRRYDLDFRVEPRDQSYVVREVVIHRDGKLVDGKWVWTPRQPPRPIEVPVGSGF